MAITALRLVLAAGAVLVVGCGDDRPERVAEMKPVSLERELPETDPEAVALTVDAPATSAESVSLPVRVETPKTTEAYWSVTAAEIANHGERPAGTAGTIDAGSLVLPRSVHPGRVHGSDTWLIEMPVVYAASAGFDRPLTRIDVTLTLSGEAKDWRIMAIRDVGHRGLRFGPVPPAQDGGDSFWFRSDQLWPALERVENAGEAAWTLEQQDVEPLPTEAPLYAVVTAPKGAKRAKASIDARVWFAKGGEATLTLPTASIAIELTPPPPVKNAKR